MDNSVTLQQHSYLSKNNKAISDQHVDLFGLVLTAGRF